MHLTQDSNPLRMIMFKRKGVRETKNNSKVNSSKRHNFTISHPESFVHSRNRQSRQFLSSARLGRESHPISAHSISKHSLSLFFKFLIKFTPFPPKNSVCATDKTGFERQYSHPPPPHPPTKTSNNHGGDPSQHDRLDIKPGRVMKMPFICPSDVMIAAELTTGNGREGGGVREGARVGVG